MLSCSPSSQRQSLSSLGRLQKHTLVKNGKSSIFGKILKVWNIWSKFPSFKFSLPWMGATRHFGVATAPSWSQRLEISRKAGCYQVFQVFECGSSTVVARTSARIFSGRHLLSWRALTSSYSKRWSFDVLRLPGRDHSFREETEFSLPS